MQNIGEEICGEYLKNILKCDFVTYNVETPDTQGEIDVVAIQLSTKRIFICESATHTQGLQYVTNKQPDNYNRFYSKFVKGIAYARKYFPDYENIVPMIWSPIVKESGEKAKHNAYKDLRRLEETIKSEFGLELKLVINEDYQTAISNLKEFALKTTSAFSSPVMRLFQVEAHLDKFIDLQNRKKAS